MRKDKLKNSSHKRIRDSIFVGKMNTKV